MKNLYQISVIALLAALLAGCAKNYYKMGNEKFESMAYSKAIIYYEKSLTKEQNPNAIINLADSYRLVNNTVKAEEWYLKVVKLPLSRFKYPIHKLYLAEALKANEKYEEAAEWLNKYLKDVPRDQRAINLLQFCDSIAIFKAEAYLYNVEALPVNTKEANFSPVFYDKGIVFCSERTTGKKYEWTGNPFLDLYYCEPLDSGKFSKPVKLKGAINSNYHEGPATFTAKGPSEIYFTRSNIDNNKLTKSKDNTCHLKICKAILVEDKWKEAEDFPFNNKEYSVGHPSISPDGKLMYFVSDVPGGLGGTDIYVSRNVQGKWSVPVNLGKAVNTAGNESFPFYYNNGEKTYLFFSSNGKPGLGGLDIYRSDIVEDTIMKNTIHISAPINSSKDDFGFIIDNEYKRGYFSSNRDSLIDKIYKFSINEPQFNLEASVMNSLRKKPLDNTKIILLDLTRNKQTELVTDLQGKAYVSLSKGTNYKIISRKEGYVEDSMDLSTIGKTKSETFKSSFMLKPVIKVRCIVINKETKLPLSNATVQLVNNPGKEEKTFKTGVNGDFEYEVMPDMNYHFIGRKEKYFSATKDLSTMGKYDSEIFEVTIELEEIILNKAIRMDNIYYDYNKWDIRPDAGTELDKLVKLLVENPEIRIELSSHTDSRGADAYNLKLSQKRAESAVKYIVSKGIAPIRITAKGYGESIPLNKCKNGVPCNEDEYQFNRRTEFKVVKITY